jgi:gluconate kinase
VIFLLFGEMGVGKNYVGKRMARQLSCPFFDGDDAIPDQMMVKIERFKILSLGELDHYVHDHLIPAIRAQAFYESDIVVAQALYRRKHRKDIVRAIEHDWSLYDATRNKVVPVWLKPPSLLTHIKRLLGRDHGFKWLVYALVTKLFFQRPERGTAVIVNETGDNLADQIRKITER